MPHQRRSRKKRRNSTNSLVVSLTRIVILLLLQALIIQCYTKIKAATGFLHQSSSSSSGRPYHHHYPYHHRNMPIQTRTSSSSPSSSTAPTSTQLHALLRPDWLRKASRVKRIQQRNNRANLESLSSSSSSVGNKSVEGKLFQCCNPSIIEFDDSSSSSSQTEQVQFPSPSWKEQRLNVYLNIPETEYEANDQTNILCRLGHGDIVRSVSSMISSSSSASSSYSVNGSTSSSKSLEVNWIEHDMGGWSPTIVDGMTRLVPIDDDDDDDSFSGE